MRIAVGGTEGGRACAGGGTLVEKSVWGALEAGWTGRMLGIVVTVAFNLRSARNLDPLRNPVLSLVYLPDTLPCN